MKNYVLWIYAFFPLSLCILYAMSAILGFVPSMSATEQIGVALGAILYVVFFSAAILKIELPGNIRLLQIMATLVSLVSFGYVAYIGLKSLDEPFGISTPFDAFVFMPSLLIVLHFYFKELPTLMRSRIKNHKKEDLFQ